MTTRVPIRYGGTGANTAADARIALEVSSSETTNAAYAQANSAFDQANNAYAVANTANTNALDAFDQANSAFNSANSAANTVRVSQNSNSTLSAKQLNFVNTANVTIAITDSGDGNANVEIFSAAGGGAGIANFPVSANSESTVTANALNFVNSSSVLVSVATGVTGNANISFTALGAAANLEIKDEGSSVTGAVTSIDFVGPGVTATASGSDVTVTISGGGGGGSNTIIGSDLFTAANADANLTYTLSEAVPGTNYVFVSKNGISLIPGVDYIVEPDYQTLRVIEAGQTNDAIEVRYFTPLSAVLVPNTTIVIDSNTVVAQTNTFSLTSNVTDITLLTVTKNGLFLTPNSHFALSDNNVVTLTTVAEIGDELVFRYFRDQGIDEVSNNAISSAFTADGIANTYFMNSFALDANNILVTIDGIVLTPGVEYEVSGPVLTIAYTPGANSIIEARTITGGGDGSVATLGFYRNSYIGDGNTVNFTLGQTPYDEDNCLVFVDRILQRNSEYNVSATTLTFTGAPDANSVIDVFVTNYLATNKALIKTGDTMTGNLNVAATLITQNVIPNANVTYDLGSNTKRFKDLWLSNSTIYLGEASISAQGGNVSFGNSSIQLSNVTTKLNVTNDLFVSGNVGIGATNLTEKLQISGNVRIGNTALNVDDNNDYYITSGGQLNIIANDGTAINDSFVGLNLSAGYQTANSSGITIRGSNSTPNGNYINFNVGGSERARIIANGNFGIGTTNPVEGVGGTNGFSFIITGTGGGSVLQFNGENGRIRPVSGGSRLEIDGGNLFLNQNYNTNVIMVGGGGKVGIATQTPNAQLSFGASIGDNKIYVFDGNNDKYGFGIRSSQFMIYSGAGGDANGGITFGKFDGTTFTENMRVRNDGIVTIPGQPGFKIAWGSRDSIGGGGRILGTNQGDAVESGRDSFNRGTHYNTATGRFTCPATGMYMFGISFMRNFNNGAYLDVRIRKNGGATSTWGRTYADPYTANYQQSMLTMITDAVVNDYFEFWIGPTTSIYNDDTYCFGHLIG